MNFLYDIVASAADVLNETAYLLDHVHAATTRIPPHTRVPINTPSNNASLLSSRLTPDRLHVKRPPPSLQITPNFLGFYGRSHGTTLEKNGVAQNCIYPKKSDELFLETVVFVF